MSVPLVVATVFAATFLVVCAIAYVLLGRSSRPAETAVAAPPLMPATPVMPETPGVSASSPPTYEIHAVRASASPVRVSTPLASEAASAPDASALPAIATARSPLLQLYRVLMFVTGATGLLASWLMFSAVEGFSRLLVIALAVFLGSCLAIYRGFVPDRELTGKK